MSAFHLQGDVPVLSYGDLGAFIGSSITVCKIPLLQSSTRLKPVTESQRALSCLLEKRRLLYHTRQRILQSCPVTSFRNDFYGSESANTTANFADNELSFEDKGAVQGKKKVIKSTNKRKKKVPKPSKGDVLGKSKPTQEVSKPKQSSFVEVDSEELAERVVNHAKLRMRMKHEKALSEAYSRPVRTSTPIPINQGKLCPKVCRTETNTPASLMSPDLNKRKTDSPVGTGLKNTCGNGKGVHQVLSTSSSLELSPTSPQGHKRDTNTVVHLPNQYLKFTLKMRAAEHQAKLAQEAGQRALKLKLEEERKAQRLTAMKLKAQQRAEIYALNEVMAKFEKEQFEAATSVKV